MLKIQQQLRQQLKLTPQQVQFLKLLQLPTLALEQRMKTELEINPLLEESIEEEQTIEQEPVEDKIEEEFESPKVEDSYTLEDYMNDEQAGYKSPDSSHWSDDEDQPEPFIPATIPLSEELLRQFRLQDGDEINALFAEEILGNVDEDGYLRRDLKEIMQDLNLGEKLEITIERAENVLKKIQLLDPPGIAARNLKECLLAQVRAGSFEKAMKELAIKLLTYYFEEFEDKHYDKLRDKLQISKDTLKKLIELIQKLNPKPGEGYFSAQENYVIPDFIVTKDESGNFNITLNDRYLPSLRINRSYQDLITVKKHSISAETKDFIRKKFESAKFFIASIQQRRETLLKVMKVIIERQRGWFEEGKILKPLIYKNISSEVGYDISTISRVVTSKYVQTEFGVFPLRHFFTSGMTSDNGEDISAQAIKQELRGIISEEDPKNPLSDEMLTKIFKTRGLTIARRTVAKYREQLGLPVARLRRKME